MTDTRTRSQSRPGAPHRADTRPPIATTPRRHPAPARDDGTPAATLAPRGTETVANNELDLLFLALAQVAPDTHPRTARLLSSGTRKIAQKVIEEAGEVAIEAVRHRTRGIVAESADLLYQLVALWYRAGIAPDDVWIEMRHRAEQLGIAEKPPKARHRDRACAADAVIAAPTAGRAKP